jgi:EAL domain-containing protein (putative c-di-GMP-specific phosphodiesterase class I)
VNKGTYLEADPGNSALVDDLSQALSRDEFFLVYQPTIDLESNAFAGVEALIRWRNPARGVVKPEMFIPELEHSGLIASVGKWALDTACQQGAVWHAKGYRFSVSVNISIKQLESPIFVDNVNDALASSRFDPALLVLEFSQEVLLTTGLALNDTLSQLRGLGIHLAIDDFVPGVSSLTSLERFPVDIIKLDRGFINGISSSPDNVELIHPLVVLGRSLNLLIVASGIEDIEQRRRLQGNEVRFGQGFLFSAPHEAEQIDQFLENFAIFSGKPL